MTHVTTEQISDALSHVLDPDLKRDLISLQMIENITISNSNITFDLVLTTPACPLKSKMELDCKEAIAKYVSPDLNVAVKFSSRVRDNQQMREIKLPGVKNVIAVVSGKGGVGKSTIAANLAVALARLGAKVGLIDADIYGPSIPIMFGLVDYHPQAEQVGDKTTIIPAEKYGVKLISTGFFIDPDKALAWRGPMASNALRQLFSDTKWGELDYLICDMPPGTGDIHLTLVQSLTLSGAVVVGTPQQVAVADVKKAVSLFSMDTLTVPILGIVENMAYFTPAELPNNKYYIFGKDGCKKLAESLDIPLLGQIPIVQSISESGDAGRPVVTDDDSLAGKAFTLLAQNVAQQLSIKMNNN
ncbi:MAG: Mrp/NBP35 family ATP-binding protein [Bacteroidota bacterium]